MTEIESLWQQACEYAECHCAQGNTHPITEIMDEIREEMQQ